MRDGEDGLGDLKLEWLLSSIPKQGHIPMSSFREHRAV
jgi:hypothetical protein